MLRVPFRILIFSLLVTLLISGCGFRLRGMVDMPLWLSNIAVETKSVSPDLSMALASELQSYKILVNPDPTKADYILIVERDLSQRQLTSVSASTTPRQYQLYYSVWFSLISTKGKVLISSDSVTLSRQLTIDNDRILGSDFEDATINREMRREAAMRILSSISRKAATINVN